MKKTIISALMFLSAILFMVSCHENNSLYDGPDYIGFADTLNYVPVIDSEEYFDIPISATRVSDQDRTVAVEIIDSSSNAIENYHYELESNTIVIPAGERTANVKARGVFSHVKPSDELSFCLRLIIEEDKDWNLYSEETRVEMRKFCEFNIDAFVGPCLVASDYIKKYFPALSKPQRLTRSELVEGEENTIVIKDFFYDGYDFKLTFDLENPYNPRIRFDQQIFANTADAFSNVFGDGKIRIEEVPGAGSFYSNCEDFIMHYMLLKVHNDGSDKVHDEFFAQTQGIVGAFMTAVEWISEAEAEKYEKYGY